MISLSNFKKDQNQQKQTFIDLNCDIAQSYGVYKNDLEYGILPHVSSVNISCGSHAGDPVTIMNAIKIAKEHNLAVGAHIGYPDIQGFGYRAMNLNDDELQAIVLYQIGALNSLAKAYNVQIEHVRPHGALYRLMAQNLDVSVSIAKAIAKFDPWIILVGAAGDILNKTAEITNIRIAPEIHIDKKYNVDGTFDFDNESPVNQGFAAEQLELIIRESCVKNIQDGKTKINFKTIHMNVKSEFSVQIAKRAKELIGQPVPIQATLVSNTGWV
jgi:UPF0271 protein